MPLVPMKDLLLAAKEGRYAVGAFNIVDFSSLQAVVAAAEAEKAPAIIQTTAGSTVKYFGLKVLVEMARQVAGPSPMPIALHLDHCTDPVLVMQAIDAGWTSVMYDGSSQPWEVNLRYSQEIVAHAHTHGVSVEGEIGAVWGVEDDIKAEENPDLLADPVATQRYVEMSGIDAIAPAIGTAHGLYKGEPKLDFERLARIVSMVKAPVVIHGGTGLSDEVFQKLIAYGGTKINISTQVKIAFFEAFRSYQLSGGKIDPIKLFKKIQEDGKEIIRRFIQVFGSSGKS